MAITGWGTMVHGLIEQIVYLLYILYLFIENYNIARILRVFFLEYYIAYLVINNDIISLNNYIGVDCSSVDGREFNKI